MNDSVAEAEAGGSTEVQAGMLGVSMTVVVTFAVQ